MCVGKNFIISPELKHVLQHSCAYKAQSIPQIVKLLCNYPFESRILEKQKLIHDCIGQNSILSKNYNKTASMHFLYSNNTNVLPGETFLKVKNVLEFGKPCYPITEWGQKYYGDLFICPFQLTDIESISFKALTTNQECIWNQHFDTSKKASFIQVFDGFNSKKSLKIF